MLSPASTGLETIRIKGLHERFQERLQQRRQRSPLVLLQKDPKEGPQLRPRRPRLRSRGCKRGCKRRASHSAPPHRPGPPEVLWLFYAFLRLASGGMKILADCSQDPPNLDFFQIRRNVYRFLFEFHYNPRILIKFSCTNRILLH